MSNTKMMKKNCMKGLKSVIALGMVVALCVPISGCGKSDKLTIGRLSMLDQEKQEWSQDMKEEENTLKKHAEIKEYQSITNLKMALDSGLIDVAMDSEGVIHGILEADGASDNVTLLNSVEKPIYHKMMFLPEKKDLRDKIDQAITDMKADGSYDKLVQDELYDEKETDSKEISKIENADTIKVAVTGDMGHMDYFGADGKPEGFSVDFLKEISKRIHLNIEFVSVQSEARLTALLSGKVDVVFWYNSVGKEDQIETKDFCTTKGYLSARREFYSEKYTADELFDKLEISKDDYTVVSSKK